MVTTAGSLGLAEILDQGTYVPTLAASTTNPTLGTGSTQSGWWKRIDTLIIGEAFIRFGTAGTAAGSGNYHITLPFAVDTAFELASGGWGLGSPVAVGGLRDNSGPSSEMVIGQVEAAGDRVLMRYTAGLVTAGGPWAWAAQDALFLAFKYMADPAAL